MTEPDVFTGGCACGQLTFAARGRPKRVGLCHCMTCRKISGSPFNAFTIFPADQVTVSGEVATWSAAPGSERCFCPRCGCAPRASWAFPRTGARCPEGLYFGCIRRAPSRRIPSPLSMSFSMMLRTRAAYSSGRPSREGNGTLASSALR